MYMFNFFFFISCFTSSFRHPHSSLVPRLTLYPWAEAACEVVQAGCCVLGCRGAGQAVPLRVPCPSSPCWGSSPSPAAVCWGWQGTSLSLQDLGLSGDSHATSASLAAVLWGGEDHLVIPSKACLCLPQQLHVQGLRGEQPEGQRPRGKRPDGQ